jgi:drug/metabolite transporter (DMT)-like permease
VSRLFVGLSLALAASVALNVSYVMQHVASASFAGIDIRRPVRTIRALVSSRLWLAGGALGLTGWALHIVALTKAPLSLVQAFLVGGIALVAPLAVRFLGHQMSDKEVLGVLLMVLSLVALTVGRGRIGVHDHYRNWVLASYLIVSCGAGAALLLAERRRAQALGLAGGFLYGAADVAIKALSSRASARSSASNVGCRPAMRCR